MPTRRHACGHDQARPRLNANANALYARLADWAGGRVESPSGDFSNPRRQPGSCSDHQHGGSSARTMITGMRAIVFSPGRGDGAGLLRRRAEPAVRRRGRGWLIFALPPAELAVHPADGDGPHEPYLMCDDSHATLAGLRAKGVEVARDISIRAGACWRRSACQTAENSPLTSPGTHHRRNLEQAHSFAGR
jgi:hypothetical protein